MKLGLISDIHADLTGLKRALAFLHSRGVDQIMCAGDLVEKGTDGDAVVMLLREQNIPCVMGNHDEMAYGNQIWMRENGERGHPALEGRWLSDETLKFVMTLPKTRRYEFGELSLLLAHGSATSNVQYVFAFSSPQLLYQTARNSEADVLVLGHTHEPMWVKIGGRWIFNPGSTHRLEGHTCAILELPAMKYEVYHLESLKLVQPEHRSFEI